MRIDFIRHGTLTHVLCSALILLSACHSAEAQEELPAPRTTFPDRTALIGGLLNCKSSDKLLETLTELAKQDRLRLLGDTNLAWTTMTIPGWRWEATNREGGRTILAIEDALLVAIYESKYAGIRMSIMDAGRLNHTSSLPDQHPYAFASKRVTAMSVKHFSRKSPELFKVYYHFAGPTADIVSSKALPIPTWARDPAPK